MCVHACVWVGVGGWVGRGDQGFSKCCVSCLVPPPGDPGQHITIDCEFAD